MKPVVETEPKPLRATLLTAPTGSPVISNAGERARTRVQRPIASIDRPIRGAIPLPHQTAVIRIRLRQHTQPQARRRHRRPIRQRRRVKPQQPRKHLEIAKHRPPANREERIRGQERHGAPQADTHHSAAPHPHITIIAAADDANVNVPDVGCATTTAVAAELADAEPTPFDAVTTSPHRRTHIRTHNHIRRPPSPPNIHTRPHPPNHTDATDTHTQIGAVPDHDPADDDNVRPTCATPDTTGNHRIRRRRRRASCS